MPRYKLTIRYDGSGFHGWQEQCPPDSPALRTVQQAVRQALQEVAKQPIEVTGASRTDTGVHAEGQVAHFDAELSVPTERLALAINARLDDDVEIVAAEKVPGTFHAIRGAVDKQYRYRIWNARRRPLGVRHLVYHCWMDLDADRMNDAAQRLIGEHDFAAFTNAGHGRQSTVRTIFDCRVERGPDPELHVIVRGSGFLYNMVRIIVGTLIEVGRGHWEPGYVDELLQQPDRQNSGPTVPPNGLCLEWIRHR
jgi:tRNA pseudouridine38-40 synthase